MSSWDKQMELESLSITFRATTPYTLLAFTTIGNNFSMLYVAKKLNESENV